MLELGNLVKARLDVRDAALGPMRELHKFTHQPVNLSVRQGDENRLHRAHLQRTLGHAGGARRRRTCAAAPDFGGQALSGQRRPDTRVRAYATRTGLAGHTRNSLTEIGALERELAIIRQRGLSRDDEELELGVRCMAAGIYDDQAKLVAGLSISAPADRLEESWLARLKETAAQISASLGLPRLKPQAWMAIRSTGQ